VQHVAPVLVRKKTQNRPVNDLNTSICHSCEHPVGKNISGILCSIRKRQREAKETYTNDLHEALLRKQGKFILEVLVIQV